LQCQADLERELVVLDRFWRRRLKKGRQLFEDKKCTVFSKRRVKKKGRQLCEEIKCTPDKIMTMPMKMMK